ncbi:MAG: histidine phosphatase family protein [Thermoplasmata archaeon]
MKLIIARHGQTQENIEGILQGHLPGTLSKKGIRQANKLAERLKKENIDHIYSSDLARAADTAQIIAEFHPKVPLKFTEKLRERDAGELQGMNLKGRDWLIKDPVGGETVQQLYDRANDFLNKIKENHPNQTILLVCHGGIGKALYAAIKNQGTPHIKATHDLKNASITIIKIEDDYEIISFNDVEHLS